MANQKQILVAGGAGFIGANLVRRLLKLGHKVTVLDNFCTGSRENLAEVIDQIEIIESDIRYAATRPEFNGPTPSWQGDTIVNLACPASPPQYQKDPLFTWETSILGNLNMVDLALKANAHYIFASTSEVYGDPLIHPQTESYNGNVNPIGPRACYDEGKRGAETYVVDARRAKNLKATLVRIFNTYGPLMDIHDGRVVSNFICQALRGEELTIYGDGNQTRSFCFVDDLVAGFVAIIESGQDKIGPFNMGNPGEFTIKELAEKVIAKIYPEVGAIDDKITYKDLPADDPKLRRPDITRLKENFGWQPEFVLDKGLDQTIAYFRGLLEKDGTISPAATG